MPERVYDHERTEMIVKLNGAEISYEYERQGPYHHFLCTDISVSVAGLHKDKAYAKFVEDLKKAVLKPRKPPDAG